MDAIVGTGGADRAKRAARPAAGTGRRMPLVQHFRELRKRLFRAAIGLFAGMVLGFVLTDVVWAALQEPIARIAEAQHAELVFPAITSAFDLRLRIALYLGVILSSPVWLFQLFAFLVPGLTRRERGLTFGFLGSAVPLFFAGCVAGWVVLPHIVELMAGFVPTGSATFLQADSYLDFVLKLMIALGIAFVLPVFLVLFNFVGILSAAAIISSWRIAILAIVLFTAIATPAADVVSMFLLAIPMVVLYFVAWFIARVHDRRAARRLAVVLGEDPDRPAAAAPGAAAPAPAASAATALAATASAPAASAGTPAVTAPVASDAPAAPLAPTSAAPVAPSAAPVAPSAAPVAPPQATAVRRTPVPAAPAGYAPAPSRAALLDRLAASRRGTEGD